MRLPWHRSQHPIIGWRTWQVVGSGLEGQQHYRWRPGRNTAVCLSHGPYSYWSPGEKPVVHEAPDPECKCGMWSQRREEPTDQWHRYWWGRPYMSGFVRQWGTVIEHERGWRSQYAEILGPLVLELTCFKHRRDPLCVDVPQVIDWDSRLWCMADGHQPEPRKTMYPVEDYLAQIVPELEANYRVEVMTYRKD